MLRHLMKIADKSQTEFSKSKAAHSNGGYASIKAFFNIVFLLNYRLYWFKLFIKSSQIESNIG